MTWPNDVTTRVVTGTYYTSTGAPAKGRVTFTPTVRVVDVNDAIIIEDTVTAPLSIDGDFEVELPTTDNLLLYPAGWAYEVNVRLYGVKPEKFYIFLPYGDGSSVDIVSDLSNTTSYSATSGAPVGITQGPIGPRGPGTLIGSGLPSSTTGYDGDIYIDSDTGYYYGPKANGEWPIAPAYTPATTTPNERYVHTQASVSSTWSITHALGGRPSVTVVDSSGTVVIGDINYNSDTQVTISFTSPFSGYAYLT